MSSPRLPATDVKSRASQSRHEWAPNADDGVELTHIADAELELGKPVGGWVVIAIGLPRLKGDDTSMNAERAYSVAEARVSAVQRSGRRRRRRHFGRRAIRKATEARLHVDAFVFSRSPDRRDSTLAVFRVRWMLRNPRLRRHPRTAPDQQVRRASHRLTIPRSLPPRHPSRHHLALRGGFCFVMVNSDRPWVKRILDPADEQDRTCQPIANEVEEGMVSHERRRR